MIHYEFSRRPDVGETMQVAPGIVWLRMPLPFALGHINLWLLKSGDGWTIVDTGVNTEESAKVWDQTFSSVMNNQPVDRVVVTHLHPDHAGCAGWLCARTGATLMMTREEYLLCRLLLTEIGRPALDAGKNFYTAAGFAADALHHYAKMFGIFSKLVSPLPDSYQRLNAHDEIVIGEHCWKIIVGRGHSPEHACLYCEEQNILISGDQLLPTISSNVSVYPAEPAANPLLDWLTTLVELKDAVPEDVLVLPAHGEPFRGAHERLDELVLEHRDRLEELEADCRQPKRATDVFSILFKREIGAGNIVMATGEAIAHLNYLVVQGRVEVEMDSKGVSWYRRK